MISSAGAGAGAADYLKKDLKDWPIYYQDINDTSKNKVIKQALIQLEKDLTELETLLSKKHLRKLKKVAIWITYNSEPGAAYHPSEQWLTNNNRNPKMAKAIEIQNAQNYVDWVKTQPMLILHELAHAYHHQVLGFNHKEILQAYNNAKKQGSYDSVEYVLGGKKKAYAMNNEKEYFSELTEAYFGKNDFYPFTRAQLKQHDPAAYQLIEKIWSSR